MTIHAYIDGGGVARAEVAPPFGLLGAFLEGDVQADRNWTLELLGVLAEVQEGVRAQWEGTGNAHTVTIQRGRVRIETEWAIPPEEISISCDEFERALRAWFELLDPR